jgi:hypothetical protein
MEESVTPLKGAFDESRLAALAPPGKSSSSRVAPSL